jgi:hypothetical protein
VARNTFVTDSIALQFRGPGDVTVAANKFEGVAKEIAAESAYNVRRDDGIKILASNRPKIKIFGRKHPVGARAKLRGRENIIMTEWGPWDHASPLRP